MDSTSSLHVAHLGVDFKTSSGVVHAVRDASFEVRPGRICGLVGESGSGKTVTGLAVTGLIDAERTVVSGSFSIGGVDLTNASERQFRAVRGCEVGMVFQDPMTALNPLLTVGRQVSESMQTHLGLGRRDAKTRAVEVLRSVGMPDPENRYNAYPHQLSGGLRQRAMIAVAVSCEPTLLIADEPTTALDVTIQAQILRLLRGLARDRDMAILLITHDLGVVAQTCDDVVVMYAGEVVETGSTEAVLDTPRHPYTKRLLEARPRLDGWNEVLDSIPGRVPPGADEPEGCLFAPRCREAGDGCDQPQVLVQLDSNRQARCWRTRSLEASRS